MLLAACSTVPEPVRDPEHPAARRLVNLRTLDPSLRFDVRYASVKNFTGQQLYPIPAVWLHQDAARALVNVQRDLRKEGLGLKVFDGYRPYHVQARMWDLIRDERYVSNPAKNAGRHTRGTAVDVTLVDLKGRELPMPTAFDDFTERAHRGAAGISARAAKNSQKLERAMVRHGFIAYPYEWWHFDLQGWEQRPPLDVPLTSLTTRTPPTGHVAH
jgi:D-alanyl-D-alanine dipeptidase